MVTAMANWEQKFEKHLASGRLDSAAERARMYGGRDRFSPDFILGIESRPNSVRNVIEDAMDRFMDGSLGYDRVANSHLYAMHLGPDHRAVGVEVKGVGIRWFKIVSRDDEF
jgi:hypothetical protein